MQVLYPLTPQYYCIALFIALLYFPRESVPNARTLSAVLIHNTHTIITLIKVY